MRQTLAAGGVVVNKKGQILVVNQNGDSWSLPKGHIDEGESDEKAAVREIAEETGITSLKQIKKFGTYQRYRIRKGGIGDDMTELKFITMFLFQTDQMELKPADPSNPAAKWLEAEKVAALLTHPRDKIFFENILPDVQDFIAENHLSDYNSSNA